MNQVTKPTVIVGAGFTGLFTALHLRHQHSLLSHHRDQLNPIILIDPQTRFVFKPMLYDILTGELAEDAVCPAYSELLKHSQITFVQDRVSAINLRQKQITLASGEQYSYHYLVLGVGSIQSYMGTEGAENHAFAFRTRENALALQSQLRDCLLRASQTNDQQQRQSLLTFVIVGAGPTGVEMAATLADLLPNWYAKLGGNIHEIRIVLVNHSNEILKGDSNAHLKDVALKALKTRTVAVELLLGVSVKAVGASRLEYQRANSINTGTPETETLLTQTTIWTAGTATHPLILDLNSQLPPDQLNKHGLPLVSPTLQLPTFPEVFVAGDCAEVQGNRQPALAQVAYQQGNSIAHNLIALREGKPLHPAEVKLRGTLMKLGLGNSVANLFDKVQINGKTADLIRSVTYLELLPTPLQNFKATIEWLKEETFHNYNKSD